MNPELIVEFKGDTSDLDKAFARVKGHLDDTPGMMGKASDAGDKLSKSNNNLNNSFGNLIKGYIGLQAAIEGGRMFLDATKAVQKYENQLKVASGTQENYAKNTAFLEGLADKYNKNVLELGKNFAQLTIATRGTNLEGEKTERLFAAVTATSAALQMSVDETNGTFQAFIQMVSKGNVQAEELRGQLGERLYGAFGLAAKSMGVTTQELNKMLERGEVLASDLLPKLTVELENTFGEQAQQNANNLGSNIDYATGQATLFFAELGKTSGITDGLNSMASAMGSIFNQLRKLNSESGIVGGFFDRMFTLPGNKLSGGGAGQDPFDIADKKFRDQLANMGKGKSSAPFSNAQSTTDTGSYGAQYGIRDLNPSAEAKIQKQNEIAASKAAAAINRWISDEIQKSKDRIAEGLLNAEIANNAAFRQYNTGMDPMGQRSSTGIESVYNTNTMSSSAAFSSPVTGDGSAANYDHIIAGMDDAIKQIQTRYARIQNSTVEFSDQLNESLTAAFRGFAAQSLEGMGALIGGLLEGTAGLDDVGNVFLGIMAGLFDNIGKALASYAATLLIAEVAMGSMNIAAAAAGAVLAFGAAAVLKSQMQKSGEQAFYSGGIVQGRGGVDNVHTALSPGEMVLNGGQQGRLWNMITGANTGREFSGSRSGGLQMQHVTVHGRIRAGDIDLSGKQGARKNNYFRGN
jgi:tape measure domain-containing protein